MELNTGHVNLTLQDKQEVAFLSPANEILYGGAAGGGKSHLMRVCAIYWCLRVANFQAYFFRRHYEDLIKNHMGGPNGFRMMLAPLVECGDVTIVEKEIRFNRNGSKIFLCHCNDEDDVYQYWGAEIHAFFPDELTHFCVHPETDVLTSVGWKRIYEVKPGERAASINEKYEIEFHEVTKVWEFPYKGDLIEVDQKNGISMSVTPNHKCVIEFQRKSGWRFCDADGLPAYPQFVYGGVYSGTLRSEPYFFSKVTGRGIGTNQNSAESIPIEDWLEFLGWYLSEGSAFGGSKSPRISIRQTKENASLKALMDRLPWRSHALPGEGYLIFSRQLYEELKPMGSLYEKRVPSWVFHLSLEQRKIFLDAFIAGDGHIDKYGAIGIGLANKGLAEDIQVLLCLAGYRATYGYNDNSGAGSHRVSANKRSKFSISVKKEEIRRRFYEGPVFCLTIDPHHNFIARRNGRVFVTGNTEQMYRFLRGRCRAVGLNVPEDLKGKFPCIMAGSNPGNIGHQWVKTMFIDPAEPYQVWRVPKEEGGTLRQFIPATLEDNPKLMEEDPEYESKLLGLGSEEYVKAIRWGSWDVLEGAFFTEFNRKKHVLPVFPIPKTWKRFRSFDWGFAKPFCVHWWAIADGEALIADDGTALKIPRNALVCYREWYGCTKPNVGIRLTPELIAAGIKQREKGESFSYSVADPSIFKQDGGPSIGERFASYGVVFRGGDNSRVSGWSEMRARLSAADAPMIYFLQSCIHTIRTIPIMQYDDVRQEDLDTDHEDHAVDSVRYACMSRPFLSKQKKKKTSQKMTLDELVKFNKEWKRREYRKKANFY